MRLLGTSGQNEVGGGGPKLLECDAAANDNHDDGRFAFR